MEEKNLNEAQAAEQTTSQDENKNEQMSMTEYFDSLKAENEKLKDENKNLEKQKAELIEKLSKSESSLDWNRKQYVEYMSQREILKKTLEELCKRKNICNAEMYEAMMTANDMDLDMVLTKLGKNL
jgi:chromosome segregation ATPase